MTFHRPIIDSWHGYKYPDGSAEIVVVGFGFGALTGSVRLNVRGGGTVNAVVKSWSPTHIVVVAPADAIIQRVHVYTVTDRGKEKQSAQSPAGEIRSTYGTDPEWSVISADDTVEQITVTGTGLDAVEDVILYDSAAPENLILATHIASEDGSELAIDWPAAYTAPIQKMRLSDANLDHVVEIDGGAAGWTADPNGVILDVSTSIIGQYAVLSIVGLGFGDEAGGVDIAVVGEAPAEADILAGGWSDSLVQVMVAPSTSYDQIILTRADGEVATLDPGVVLPVTTPSLDPVITAVSAAPLQLTVEGTGLASGTYLNTYRGGVLKSYDLNTLETIYPGSTFGDTLISVFGDQSADNLDPVDRVQVITPTGASNDVVAPALGGPWDMDDPNTSPVTVFGVSYVECPAEATLSNPRGKVVFTANNDAMDDVTRIEYRFSGSFISLNVGSTLVKVDSETLEWRTGNGNPVTAPNIQEVRFWNGATLLGTWTGSVSILQKTLPFVSSVQALGGGAVRVNGYRMLTACLGDVDWVRFTRRNVTTGELAFVDYYRDGDPLPGNVGTYPQPGIFIASEANLAAGAILDGQINLTDAALVGYRLADVRLYIGSTLVILNSSSPVVVS